MKSRGNVKIWNWKLWRCEGMVKVAEELLTGNYVVKTIDASVCVL